MSDVKINVTAAIEQASKALLVIDKNLEKLGKTSSTTGKGLTGLSGASQATSNSFMSMAKSLAGPALGFMSLSGAVAGTVAILRSSINDWVAYNEEVSKLSTTTTAGVEELSRMIQAADDLGIEMGALKTAFEFASKNGVTPTIENIANLSDRMAAMTDITARNQEMTKIFGRGWADASRFLLAGGDAIREGTAAISDSLVVTGKTAAETRAYALAIDGVRDSMTMMKNTIAQAAIPGLTDMANAFNAVVTNATDLERQMKISQFGIKEWGQYIQGAMDVDEIYANMINLATAVAVFDKAVADNILTDIQANDIKKRTQLGTEDLIAVLLEYGIVVNQVSDATVEATTSFSGLDYQYQQITQHAIEATIATEGVANAGATVRESFGGVSKVINKAAESAGNLGSKLRSVPTDIGSQIMEDLRNAKFEELGAKILEDLRIGVMSQLEAGLITKEQARAALGGLFIAFEEMKVDAGEMTKWEAWANIKENLESWGLSAEEARKVFEELQKYDGMSLTMEALVHLIGIVSGMPGGNQSGTGDMGESVGGRDYASGADFVVPPGYPNDSYPIGNAQSGERVTITPAGETMSQGTTITVNISEATNARDTAEQVIAIINRRMAGARNAGARYTGV